MVSGFQVMYCHSTKTFKLRSHVTSTFAFSRMDSMATSGIVRTQDFGLREVDRNFTCS